MQTYAILIMIGLGVIMLFSIIAVLVKRYKRCPSDKLLVVYGRTGKTKDGEISTAKVTHGGGAFVWPVIQDYSFLGLTPIPIDIQLKNALSKQNIRIDVPSTFTVAISTEKSIMQNAAERLLGLDSKAIAQLAQDIIFGQLRLVVATMDIEQINADRDMFLENIQKAVEPELQKIGLKLINVNITDINDESGYIKALGQEAASKAVNEAKVSVAQKNRDGQIGETEALKEQRIKVAEANSSAQVGEANAMQNQRIQTASANAKAIEGENNAAVSIANSNAEKEVQSAEAKRKSLAASLTKEAEALKEAYVSQEAAEKQRALKDQATQYADIVVPANISKEKMEINAEAEAERIRRIAKGEADAKYMMMDAEARGIEAILLKTAEGYEKLVKAAGSPEGAVSMIIADKLEGIIKTQVEAIKNVKIDKITVWDSGAGKDGAGSTSNFLQSMLQFIPPMDSAYKMIGQQMPGFLQGKTIEEKNNAIDTAATKTDKSSKE